MTSNKALSLVQASLSAARQTWAIVSASISGADHDYTSGSTRRALVLLAIPMVLEMGMESVFMLVDIFFVSRLGADAVTTVGLTEAVLTLLYAVAIGLEMGAIAYIARRVGERNIEGARIAAVQVIWIGLALAAVIGVLGAIYAADLLRLMGGNDNIVAQGRSYTQIMLGGSVTILLIFLLNSIFRGAGNAVIAMRALWIANGVNIVLDPCLIFGLGPFPELGVTGAAVATNIGRGVGIGYQLYCLSSNKTVVSIGLRDFRLRMPVMLRLLRVSIPGVIQFSIAMSSYIFLMRIVSAYGSNAAAGFTIAIRIFSFTYLPAWGLGNAVATLVGQNLGAGQPDRAEHSAWMGVRYNTIFLVSVAIVFIAVPEIFVSIFTSDPTVAAYAIDCLRYYSYGYGFYAIGMTLTQAFNGAGDTDTPTVINFVCFWVFQIPLAYAMANTLGMGPLGVYITIALADALLAITAVVVFRRGQWKLRKV